MNDDIVLKSIVFGYVGTGRVFEDFSFSYKRNTKVVITGANGSGKTTLFRIITGLEKIEQGEIKIFGKKRKNEKDFNEVRSRIGYMFQDVENMLFSPTVEEEIAFGLLNKGVSKSEAKDMVDRILEDFEIVKLKNEIPFKLSGGEKRIVAFCSVLAMESEIYLLDEPTVELDEFYHKKITEYLNEKINSFILITQDEKVLKNLKFDRLYNLEEGKIS